MPVKTLPKSQTIRNPQQFSAATAQARQNVNAQKAPKPTSTQQTTAPKSTAPAPKTDGYTKADPKALGYGVEKQVDSKALGYGVPTKVGTQPMLNSKLSSGYGVAFPVKTPQTTGTTPNNATPGYSSTKSTPVSDNNNSKPLPKGYAPVLDTPESKPLPKGYVDTSNTSAPAKNNGSTPLGYASTTSQVNPNSNSNSSSSTVQPQPKQISEPRSSTPEQIKALSSKEGKTGQDAVKDPSQAQPRELQGKTAAEKSVPSRKGVVDGKEVDIQDKPWQGGARGTQYMNEKQSAEAKVGFEPVKKDVNGQANAKLTQDGKTLSNSEQIFVMDPKKQVYSADSKDGVNFRQVDEKTQKPVDLHHSSFTKGGAVEGAGGLQTRTDGTLKKIDDGSGHYQPKPENTLKTMGELEKKGVNLDNTQYEMVRGRQDGKPVETLGMANEFKQGGGSETTFKARHSAVDEMKNSKDPKPTSELSRGAQMFDQARDESKTWKTTNKDVQAKMGQPTVSTNQPSLSPVSIKPLTTEEKAKGYV